MNTLKTLRLLLCLLILNSVACSTLGTNIAIVSDYLPRAQAVPLLMFQECLVSNKISLAEIQDSKIKGVLEMHFKESVFQKDPRGVKTVELVGLTSRISEPNGHKQDIFKNCDRKVTVKFNQYNKMMLSKIQPEPSQTPIEVLTTSYKAPFFPFEKASGKINERSEEYVVEAKYVETDPVNQARTYDISFRPANIEKPKWCQEKTNYQLYYAPTKMTFKSDETWIAN